MKFYILKLNLIICIVIIFSCKKDIDEKTKYDGHDTVQYKNFIDKNLSHNTETMENIEKLIKSIEKKDFNTLCRFFHFPIKDINLIDYIKMNSENNYDINLNSIDKAFFKENIDIIFNENLIGCLKRINFNDFKLNQTESFYQIKNDCKSKIELRLKNEKFYVKFYEEHLDEIDQFKYETVIEYIFKISDDSLMFDYSNLAG